MFLRLSQNRGGSIRGAHELAPLRVPTLWRYRGAHSQEEPKKGLYRLFPDYIRPIESTPADNSCVAPQAWQRFDADPAYRESCANLARISRDKRP